MHPPRSKPSVRSPKNYGVVVVVLVVVVKIYSRCGQTACAIVTRVGAGKNWQVFRGWKRARKKKKKFAQATTIILHRGLPQSPRKSPHPPLCSDRFSIAKNFSGLLNPLVPSPGTVKIFLISSRRKVFVERAKRAAAVGRAHLHFWPMDFRYSISRVLGCRRSELVFFHENRIFSSPQPPPLRFLYHPRTKPPTLFFLFFTLVYGENSFAENCSIWNWIKYCRGFFFFWSTKCCVWVSIKIHVLKDCVKGCQKKHKILFFRYFENENCFISSSKSF